MPSTVMSRDPFLGIAMKLHPALFQHGSWERRGQLEMTRVDHNVIPVQGADRQVSIGGWLPPSVGFVDQALSGIEDRLTDHAGSLALLRSVPMWTNIGDD
ncbi:hypothetical protein [Nonomuraea dietziae]